MKLAGDICYFSPSQVYDRRYCGGGTFLFPDAIGEKKMRQIHFDTAGIHSKYGLRRIQIAVDLIGAEKIVFGSDDWIEDCHCTQEVMLNAIKELGLNEEDERKILGENSAKILNS